MSIQEDPPVITDPTNNRPIGDSPPQGSNHLINALPHVREAVLTVAQNGWDTGVSSEMLRATYSVIDVYLDLLVKLAGLYPSRHFGQEGPRAFFTRQVTGRFQWQRMHQEPDGIGTGGTIVSVIAAGAVMAELETMLCDMVRSCSNFGGSFDFEAWHKDWEQSSSFAQSP
jgi:hypothetical protein